MWAMIVASISSPPTRRLRLKTMPASEMIAISQVPPPMSTIMLPAGSCTRRPRPTGRAPPQAAAEDDPGERDDCDFAGPAADVHDHVARRLMHRQTDADGRSHRLLDQINLARARVRGASFERPFLHVGT